MSVKITKGKTYPIGVDLGTHTLKMAQLKMVDGELELMAAGLADVPESARRNPTERSRFILETIRQLLHAHPFKGRQCVLSLPAEATFVQHIKMAKMPQDQFINALQWELQGKLAYDPSRAIIRHVVAGEIYADDEVKEEIIVLAASRDTVEAHIDLVKRAKLDCMSINVEPCAIIECFARMFRRAEDADHATLFVDIGGTSTQVVISHGAHMAFAKNLFIGASQFDRALAEGLQVTLDEAHQKRCQLQTEDASPAEAEAIYPLLCQPLGTLAEELTNCLRYYESVFHNRPVERAVFLGGQAHDKRLCQNLAQRLSLPAQIGDPLARIKRVDGSGLDIGIDRRNIQPDWAVAIGLSLGSALEPEKSDKAVDAA